MIIKNTAFATAIIIYIPLAACVTQPLDPLKIYYSNTLLITQPWGETDRMLIDADGNYSQSGGRFPAAKGHWTYKSDQFCMQVIPEKAGEKPNPPFCMELKGRRIGDIWTIQIGDQQATFKIAQGRNY